MSKLTGLIAAAFTPMNGNGGINLKPISDMVAFLLKQNIRGLYVCGSTGEGPSLTTREREQVAAAYVEAAAGRIPVIVQVGHNSVEEARRLAKHAASIGAAAVSAVSPSYFLPENIAALVETFARIADAAPATPFYYYHIPRLSGLSLSPLSFLETAQDRIPTLTGVKFSSRDVDIMRQCISFDNGRYDILFGVDEMLLSGLAAGCNGAVGSTYNFLAPLYLRLISHFESGDLNAANRLQEQAARIIGAIIRHHGLAGLKAAMTFSGIPCGPPRLPLTALTSMELDIMRQDLNALGFFSLSIPANTESDA